MKRFWKTWPKIIWFERISKMNKILRRPGIYEWYCAAGDYGFISLRRALHIGCQIPNMSNVTWFTIDCSGLYNSLSWIVDFFLDSSHRSQFKIQPTWMNVWITEQKNFRISRNGHSPWSAHFVTFNRMNWPSNMLSLMICYILDAYL